MKVPLFIDMPVHSCKDGVITGWGQIFFKDVSEAQTLGGESWYLPPEQKTDLFESSIIKIRSSASVGQAYWNLSYNIGCILYSGNVQGRRWTDENMKFMKWVIKFFVTQEYQVCCQPLSKCGGLTYKLSSRIKSFTLDSFWHYHYFTEKIITSEKGKSVWWP